MMAPQRLTDGFLRQWSGPLPRIGLFGEFSAGKSSVVNLLLGRDLLPAAVLSSTRRPTMVRYAPELSIEAIGSDGVRRSVPRETMALSRADIGGFEIGTPGPLLRHMELLDTAGFADPYQDSQRTLDIVDGVDICIWCTLATQAWRDSEQKTWLGLPQRLRDRGILVATHADNLTRARDLQRLRARLQREAGDKFAAIVLLAVPDAMRAQGDSDLIADGELWRSSGGADLLAAIQRAAAGLAAVRKQETSAARKERVEQDRLALSALAAPAGTASPAPPPPSPPQPSPLAPPAAAAAPTALPAHPDDPRARAFLLKVLDDVPSCLSALWIDLEARRVLDCCGAGADEIAASGSLGVAVTNFFQGDKVQTFERHFKHVRGMDDDDRHYFKEIVLVAPACLGIMFRIPWRGDRALVVVTDKASSVGLVLTTTRTLLASAAASPAS
jgi:hypothetical protein